MSANCTIVNLVSSDTVGSSEVLDTGDDAPLLLGKPGELGIAAGESLEVAGDEGAH